MKKKSSDPQETRRERLEIGKTTLPKGHSTGINRNVALCTKKIDRSPLFDRLDSFIQFAKKNDAESGKVIKKDPVVVLDKIGTVDKEEDGKDKAVIVTREEELLVDNNDSEDNRKEEEEIELDIVLVKSSEDNKLKQDAEKKKTTPKRPLIEAFEE